MRSLKIPLWFLALAVIAAQAISAHDVFADTVSLEPSKDNTLFEDSGGGLSNGAGERLLSGRTGEPNNRRALIAFDFSSLPAGSIISSVSLTLNASKVASSSAQSTSLHRLLADWGKGRPTLRARRGEERTLQLATLPGFIALAPRICGTHPVEILTPRRAPVSQSAPPGLTPGHPAPTSSLMCSAGLMTPRPILGGF
jgi:hypothetical protein